MTKTLDPALAGPSEGNDFSYSTPNGLDRMLQKQEAFQQSLASGGLAELLPDDIPKAVDAITINVLALEDELHELLGETSWKPWAKGDFINLTAARGEFIDAWHFMLNLGNLLGFDAHSLEAAYNRKLDKNFARQKAGYDGRSTKCPGCHRALDDDGVACYLYKGRLGTDAMEDLIFCDRHGRAYRPNSGAHLEGSFE